MKTKDLSLIFIVLLSFVSQAIAQTTNDWQWQYPKPQGNTLRDIYVFNKDTAIAVGDLGTVIKTTDGGASWDVQHHAGGSGIELNSVNFIDALNGWAAGGAYGSGQNVLLKTTDGGKIWIEVKTDTTLPYNSIYFVDKDTGFVFGEDGIILRTTDGGNSWNTSSIDNYMSAYLDVFFFRAVAFTDKSTGFLVGAGYYGNEIYKTTDCGRTWQWNEGVLNPKVFGSLYDINFTDINHGFIAGDGGVFLITTDGGNTWRHDTAGSDNYSTCFTDTLNGWICGGNSTIDADYGGFIYNTTNGGINWVKAESNKSFGQLFKIKFSDKNNGWIIGQSGILYRTTDGGSNWISQREKSYNFNSIYFVDESNGWAAGDSGIILHTTDGGNNWEKQNQNDSLLFNSVYAIDTQNVFTAGLIVKGSWLSIGANILKTTNGGQTWENQMFDTLNRFNSIAFLNDSTGWVSGKNGVLLKTSDKGNNWTKIVLDTSVAETSLGKIHFINQNIGWIGSSLKTTDGGNSWKVQNIPSLSFPSSYFINESLGWMVGDSYGGSNIYRTTDGGTNWTPCGSTYPGYYFTICFSNATTGWITGYNYSNQKSIIKTTDGGNTWVGQDIPSNWLSSLFFLNENTGWAVGDGIYKTTDGGGIVSVKDEKGSVNNIPSNIELLQNYPNPFNPSTVIEYKLNKQQIVKLQVFNILGQEIGKLVDGIQSSGAYKINWNSKGLASGVYFYRLTTTSQVVTKKMLLIR